MPPPPQGLLLGLAGSQGSVVVVGAEDGTGTGGLVGLWLVWACGHVERHPGTTSEVGEAVPSGQLAAWR